MVRRPPNVLKLYPRRIPSPTFVAQCRQYAATGAAIASTSSLEGSTQISQPTQRYPPTKPPSYKPPELRKSQLLRQYTSLLRSTPLMLIFQHNNLRAIEWTAIRRELDTALRIASAASAGDPASLTDPADGIKFQVIRPSIFEVALRIVEFYDPTIQTPLMVAEQPPSTEDGLSASRLPDNGLLPSPATYSHSLSTAAYHIASGGAKRGKRKLRSSLDTLLSGPIALVTFPTVSPKHLAAALTILSPTAGANSAFPAPRRRDAPGYYDATVQQGVQKLLMLGARIEGRVMDGEGVRWVGGIEGGMDGLRAQVVHLLQGLGASVTSTLESASRSLYFTMEGRRMDLDEKTEVSGNADHENQV